LSRQLSTQPLPATPMPIGYCGRNRRFSSTNPPVLNNHSNDFKSHPNPHPATVIVAILNYLDGEILERRKGTIS